MIIFMVKIVAYYKKPDPSLITQTCSFANLSFFTNPTVNRESENPNNQNSFRCLKQLTGGWHLGIVPGYFICVSGSIECRQVQHRGLIGVRAVGNNGRGIRLEPIETKVCRY